MLKGLQLLMILMLNGQMVNVFNIFAMIKPHNQNSIEKPHFFKNQNEIPSKIWLMAPFHTQGIQPISLELILYSIFDFLIPIQMDCFFFILLQKCVWRHDNLW